MIMISGPPREVEDRDSYLPLGNGDSDHGAKPTAAIDTLVGSAATSYTMLVQPTRRACCPGRAPTD